MTGSRHLLEQAVQLADRVESLLAGDSNPIPTADPGRGAKLEPITMSTHHGYALGMYARSRSYYRGAIALAKDGLADEALALGRSLFEDSLRLSILAETRDEVHQIDGLIGWLLDGVKRAIGIYREAKRLGVGTDHEAAIDHLEAEHQKMIGYRERRGSGRKTPALFSEQQLERAALESGRSDAWWLHEVADQMVHGNYFAHRMRHVAAGDGTALVAIRHSNPRGLIDIVAFAVESVVVSHQSICAILDLPGMHELDDVMRDMERLQRAGAS